MKLESLTRALEARIVCKSASFATAEFGQVIASDLMSDVLVVDHPSPLLVTSLASDQVIRTADIVGACAVLVVNGKTLPANMKTLARECGMTLLHLDLPKFEACVRIGRLLAPAPRTGS